MGKLAFVFPGQGAQYVGMGKDLYCAFPEIRELMDRAGVVLGYDLKEIMFEGPADKLAETENTQPAIVTMSAAILSVLEKEGVKPDIAAGLSLGEYSALVSAGVMEFDDAVVLVRKRGRFMQEAVPIGKGTMAAILGLEKQEVIECCREASGYGVVEAANYNCPGQVAISGEVKAVERAVEIAKEKGAKRAVVLPVSAPFHCSMLKPAGEKLAVELSKVKIKDASIPVVANVNAREENCSAEIIDNLIKQVSSPVLWEDSIRRMIENGVDVFVEIGPGKALTGFIRKISKEVKTFNIDDIKSLESTLMDLEGIKCLS
ncbi:MAG: Malonyl CoA-acyl carrier protein transacylase [Firmicutes bacterium]|nr:Malonyl CoA-acyl carrier protein transacylase [Bacillota bacterium]MDI6704634.1 ACP S-malonyltransferase [Bacillota bacterium]